MKKDKILLILWIILAVTFFIVILSLYCISGANNKFELNNWILEQLLDSIL